MSLAAATVFSLWCARRVCLVVLWAQAATALGAMIALLLSTLEWTALISRRVSPQLHDARTLLLLALESPL